MCCLPPLRCHWSHWNIQEPIDFWHHFASVFSLVSSIVICRIGTFQEPIDFETILPLCFHRSPPLSLVALERFKNQLIWRPFCLCVFIGLLSCHWSHWNVSRTNWFWDLFASVFSLVSSVVIGRTGTFQEPIDFDNISPLCFHWSYICSYFFLINLFFLLIKV